MQLLKSQQIDFLMSLCASDVEKLMGQINMLIAHKSFIANQHSNAPIQLDKVKLRWYP
jgi:hypothetical protein